MVFVPSEFLPEYRPARKYSLLESNGWWLNHWPLLGWLETFVKMAAWLFVPRIVMDGAKPLPAATSLSMLSSLLSEQQQPQGATSAAAAAVRAAFAVETAIMLIAALLIAAAVIDRLVYREIISIMFVFPNNWAHWSVALSMLRYGKTGINVRYLRIFLLLTFAGDVIKLIFFAVHDFSRLNVSRYVLYALVAIFALMYLTMLLLDYGYIRIPTLQASYPRVTAVLLQRVVMPLLANAESTRRSVEKLLYNTTNTSASGISMGVQN